MYSYIQKIWIYFFTILTTLFNYILSFFTLESNANVRHIKWNPTLYEIEYTYSKEDYDRKYKTIDQISPIPFLSSTILTTFSSCPEWIL